VGGKNHPTEKITQWAEKNTQTVGVFLRSLGDFFRR